MSSDMFSPLPFEENDIDPNEIIERLDAASTVSDELTGRLLDSVGDQLTNVSNVEAELTTRVLTPAANVLQRANETQNELFTQLGNVVGARLGGAGELADNLSRQVPVAFDGPPVLTEETIEQLTASGEDLGDIAVGGIEPEVPPEAAATGGIEPGPGMTEGEIAVGGIEPEEEPAQDIPPTIVVPPPTTIPGPQQEEEEPPTPQPQPPRSEEHTS